MKFVKWLAKKDKKPSNASTSIEERRSEKLAQLGSQLAALREKQGLSIDQVMVITKIPRRLLNAIEIGDVNDLPEPIYVQGLITQFADALGLKGAEFARDFPIGSQKISFPSKWQPQPLFQLRPFHLYLLYVFIIFCSVNGLSQQLNQLTVETKSTQNQDNVQTSDDLTDTKLSGNLQSVTNKHDPF